ncbi:MAG: hypothetical protein NTV89_03625 [Proteobacteria bacterium]|nr:hypothetical protein [Pseudomonadota bacterium]
MKSTLQPGEPSVFYRDLRESVIFYSERRGVVLKNPEELSAYLGLPRPVFCFISIKSLEKVKELLHIPFYIVGREGFFVLISNKKPSATN